MRMIAALMMMVKSQKNWGAFGKFSDSQPMPSQM